MPYPPSDATQSIDELEKHLLATWKHEHLFTRVSEATRYGPPFIFYEGPRTGGPAFTTSSRARSRI
jgi:isoleucyl-tRNA synthetase